MGWLNSAWPHRRKITLDHTKMGGSTLANQFILLATHFSGANDGGGDLRLTEADGVTELAREIVTWDNSGGIAQVWAKPSSLSDSVDTDIYAYYGNTGASDYAAGDTYGRNAVWSALFAQYHLDDDPSGGSETDSTGNSRDLSVGTGSFSSGAEVSDQVENGIHFSGSNAFRKASTVPTLSNPWTLFGWIKTPSSVTTHLSFGFAGATEYAVLGQNSGQWKVFTHGESTAQGTSSPSNSTLYHFFLEWTGSQFNLYINNSLDHSMTPSSNNWQTAVDIVLGALFDGSSWNYHITGDYDEAGILPGNFTAAQRTAIYNNQNSPGSFYTVGSEENAIAIPSMQRGNFGANTFRGGRS